ncbi:hypothetical protein K5I29_04305 [Flavobacterium agricola]|uniref:Uncharacterized protein n=1 Tax=Flavobacterium agricola TaxID=2870839 RepID=A0ABY6M0U9_9FLAO|nr:hypothetical protein [Flavobacterium agricola]UYW02129.1 hypothetical protein K5I29_04305 [Flavobacterium agricola]
MKILEVIKVLPGVFDWYFKLTPLKRIQLNYIVLIAVLLTLFYYNDSNHRENNMALTNRIDSVNINRAIEQEKYTKQLEYYTEKFNSLLERLIHQRNESETKKVES